MKEKLKQNSNGWYAVGGSITVLLAALIIVCVPGNYSGVYVSDTFAVFFAFIAMAISILSLFCGSRKQRDGIFSGMFFAYVIMYIYQIMSSLMGLHEPDIMSGILIPAIIFIIAITMISVYEGIGNARDRKAKKAKLANSKPAKKAKRK